VAGPSALETELSGVAKVTVGESVEEGEAGDAVKAAWYRRDADNSEVPIEPESREPNGKNVGRKRASVGTAEEDGRDRDATAKDASVFFQQKLECGLLGTRARIGEEGSRKRLTALGQGEDNLNARPTMPEWPLHARHQINLQISSTTL
jgi:hypothetical protein